jgi:hypothetical protein
MVYQFKLRLAERLKLGGPSLGRSPDAHKQRRLDNQHQIQIFEEIKGRHNFWSRAKRPALFFQNFVFNGDNVLKTITNQNDGIAESDRTKF